MASTRAADVAEILWELKRADKVATFTTIAKRAGFSAGTNGRAVVTTLRTVRRDWPHLQWWRAIKDDGLLESGSEHQEKLAESGYEIEQSSDTEDAVTLSSLDEHLMQWVEDSLDEAPPSDD